MNPYLTSTHPAPLHHHVRVAITDYLATLGDAEDPNDVYELFLTELEKPLIEAVLRHTRGNQSRTAAILGLNRGTLRSKMKKLALL